MSIVTPVEDLRAQESEKICSEDDIKRYLEIFGKRIARVFDQNSDGFATKNADGEDTTVTGNPHLALFKVAKPHIIDVWMGREVSVEGIGAINNLLRYPELEMEFIKLMDYIDESTHINGSSISVDGEVLNTNHVPRFSSYRKWNGHGHAGGTWIKRLRDNTVRSSNFQEWLKQQDTINGFKFTRMGIFSEEGKLIFDGDIEGFMSQNSLSVSISGNTYYSLHFYPNKKVLIDATTGKTPKIQLRKLFGGKGESVEINNLWGYDSNTGEYAISWSTIIGGNSWGIVDLKTGKVTVHLIDTFPWHAGVMK